MTVLRYVFSLFLGVGMLSLVIPAHADQAESEFYFGVDLSYVNEMEDCGAVYRVDGDPHDPFELFADYGATLVRARLWHDPDWTDYSTLDDVRRTFRRARDAGMQTLLNFHYSDTWADPGHQAIPRAWATITDTSELAAAVYEYTYAVLLDLHTDDLTPAFVQVGNETNAGLLKRGGVPTLDWPRDAQLFNAGIRAVRDFGAATGTAPQIILHVAQPENTDWWFREAEQAGITDYDVIGISYYAQWSRFSIDELGQQVQRLRNHFGKAVMIVETAYGWTRDAANETAHNILGTAIPGYPFTPSGQRRYMTDLTQTLIDSGALGVIYWEPAWVSTPCSTPWGQGSHWENATFFDFRDGNALLEGIAYMRHDYRLPEDATGR
ncbi:MAG: glycoside hydrolase family 53 protein [Chloroflexota bacterium]